MDPCTNIEVLEQLYEIEKHAKELLQIDGVRNEEREVAQATLNALAALPKLPRCKTFYDHWLKIKFVNRPSFEDRPHGVDWAIGEALQATQNATGRQFGSTGNSPPSQ